MAVTEKIRLRVIELRAEGVSYDKISKEVGIAKQTAVDIAREQLDSISTLQAIKMEAIFEAERVNARGRIEQLAALHTRLREEIERRNLADLPTEKLISLHQNLWHSQRRSIYSNHIQLKRASGAGFPENAMAILTMDEKRKRNWRTQWLR